jgi:GNAT superfamily N-acetyltransferase
LRGRDAEVCVRTFYDAFEAIASRHNFPTEPGSPGFTRLAIERMLGNPGFAGVVAERDGVVVGSAFVDERSAIAGIGPVTVDPSAQDDGVGRALMEALVGRARERRAAGIRLVQTAYHYRSFALYAKLGFVVREPLSVIQGTPPAISSPGLGVRAARPDDVEACGDLCLRVHGHDRSGELVDSIQASPRRTTMQSRSSARRTRSWGSASSFRRETQSCSAGASTTV